MKWPGRGGWPETSRRGHGLQRWDPAPSASAVCPLQDGRVHQTALLSWRRCAGAPSVSEVAVGGLLSPASSRASRGAEQWNWLSSGLRGAAPPGARHPKGRPALGPAGLWTRPGVDSRAVSRDGRPPRRVSRERETQVARDTKPSWVNSRCPAAARPRLREAPLPGEEWTALLIQELRIAHVPNRVF